MSGDPQQPLTGWGHRIREENRGLREKIAKLRKKLEGLQREVQNAWKLLDHIPAGLMLIQQEKILFANKSVRRESGYTRKELLSMEVSDLLGSDSGFGKSPLHQRKTGDPPPLHDCETSLKTKDGQILPAELRIHKTLYQGKTAFLVHIISLDQRNAQERRRIQSVTSEALLRMASGFRRELDQCNTLLQEGVHRNQRPGVCRDSILKSLKGIAAIREKEAFLSQRLHCLSRAEYDPSELTLVDLKGLIETAVGIACPRASGGPRPDMDPVTVKTFLRGPSEIYGCRRDLQDLFVDIILNAVEAIPGGGAIYLTTEEHSGFARIYIQDNGVGMPQGVIAKIFDPFFTSKDGPWRGLGLSLCHAVIDRHQGEIGVSSQEGRGSTVVVKLPLARNDSRVRAAAPRKGLRDSHILIIGNDGVLTDILHNLFADRARGVTVVSSYKEGLRVLRDTPVDLIIADQDTFRTNTERIARQIKDLWPGLPVALINASGRSGPPAKQGKRGVDLFVGRPLDADRFLSQVARLIGKGVPPE
jgi:PAS domain S-box-containing protein